MVAVQAALIGPQADGVTPQQNPLDAERNMLWMMMNQRAGIVSGLVASVVSGQMQLSFTPGSAVVCERDGSQNELSRMYPVYSSGTAIVQFGAASASARNDAVVAAAVDVEDGAQGSGAIGVGGHLVVVPGVSGITAVRTDAEIAAFLGRGGWHRLYNVPIAAGSTQINLGGATKTAYMHNYWNTMTGATAASGWGSLATQYMMITPVLARIRIVATRTGGTITAGSDGNISDVDVVNNIPTSLRAVGITSYGTFFVTGVHLGSCRIETGGNATITDLYPTGNIVNGNEIRMEFTHPII